MAAVAGDLFSETSRLRAMIASQSSLQHEHHPHHQHPHHQHQHANQYPPQATPPSVPYESSSSSSSPPHRSVHDELAASGRSQLATIPSPTIASASASAPIRASDFGSAAPASAVNATTSQRHPTQPRHRQEDQQHHLCASAIGSSSEINKTIAATPPGWAPAGPQGETHAAGGGAARFPSPPSSSPAVATDDAKIVSMASQTARHIVSLEQQQRSAAPPSSHVDDGNPTNSAHQPHTQNQEQQQQQQQQPSPPSDDFQTSLPPGSTAPQPTFTPGLDVSPSPLAQQAAPPTAAAPQQTVIRIRDLAHVQSLARVDMRAGHGSGTLNDPPLQQMRYEISGMPIGDIIEMVAALLTKITTTNDLQHDAMQRNVAHQQQASQNNEATGSSQMSPLSHSVLAFHGKNVPAITILSYLSRIHKYCPTTYEVFLSLLVYFDRMTERVNELVSKSEEARRQSSTPGLQRQDSQQQAQQSQQQQPDVSMREGNGHYEMADSDSDLADDDDDDEEEDEDEEMGDSPAGSSRHTSSRPPTARSQQQQQIVPGPATYFVVDSFNIHRLIIAGVTCASKFFSDVFYTNSRYAKVGGLPLAELNHLELQFLVLNEFRLFVPVEDLEAYATMLVEFYAREVVGRQPPADARE